MLRNTPDNHQTNIFGTDLLQQLDPSEPLLNLSARIGWQYFHEEFKKYHKEKAAPAKPIRLMVGLLILKQLYNLSDESLRACPRTGIVVNESWCRKDISGKY